MAEIKKIPSREEIPLKDRWATEDMYPSDEAWEQELATLQEDQKTLGAFAGTLGEGGEKLFAYLSNMERVNSKLRLLANYCMRKADEDTRNPVYQAMRGKFMAASVALQTANSFMTPEVMDIPEETLLLIPRKRA